MSKHQRITMFGTLIGVLIIFTLCLSTPVLAATTEPYYGNWAVSKVILTQSDATLSKKAANAYIGKSYAFSATSATAGKVKLANPTYEVSVFSASDFTSSWGIQTAKLGLPASITMVEVYKGKGMNAELWPSCGTLFVKSAKALVMFVDGVFFELAKKK